MGGKGIFSVNFLFLETVPSGSLHSTDVDNWHHTNSASSKGFHTVSVHSSDAAYNNRSRPDLNDSCCSSNSHSQHQQQPATLGGSSHLAKEQLLSRSISKVGWCIIGDFFQ